jgi:hypothetical protein
MRIGIRMRVVKDSKRDQQPISFRIYLNTFRVLIP